MNADVTQTCTRRSWKRKFADALRGIKLGVRGQSSFSMHLFMAFAVVLAASVLSCTATEWSLLLLCIAVVLTAEMFNSALETLAKAIDRQHNPLVGDALDIGSGAVLVASIGAAVVGALVFVERLRMQ